MSAIESLAAAKSKSDARANFERFITSRRADGWTDSDVAEYRESVRTLMGDDDAAALALFPHGIYQTAEQARQAVRDYWAKP